MTMATVVRDVFGRDDRLKMRDALKQLLPVEGMDFHPSGIYSFWDPDSQDILYVGLAATLSMRFAQHVGLSGKTATGNKRKEIAAWFGSHDRLGYSIVIQSAAVALSEPKIDLPKSIIAIGEGQLLESHRRKFDRLPPWNKMAGSVEGAGWAGDLTPGYFDLLTGLTDSLLVSKRTIRGLTRDDEAFDHEMTIHGARLNALHQFGMGDGVGDVEILDALEQLRVNPLLGGHAWALDRLDESGYLEESAAHPERT